MDAVDLLYNSDRSTGQRRVSSKDFAGESDVRDALEGKRYRVFTGCYGVGEVSRCIVGLTIGAVQPDPTGQFFSQRQTGEAGAVGVVFPGPGVPGNICLPCDVLSSLVYEFYGNTATLGHARQSNG